MSHVGIDIEQFITDPYGSGIQRVLQYLAIEWPGDEVPATFVARYREGFLLLAPEQAAELVSLAFAPPSQSSLREVVEGKLDYLAETLPWVQLGELLSLFTSWLLPEVSYLPQVLERFSLFQRSMPASMIGYDALPMTEPANYRFKPGSAHRVSEYFRLLATADSVVAISYYTRDEIWNRLRRDRALPTTVAHPGGDHIPIAHKGAVVPGVKQNGQPIEFLRVGTLEARKRPLEILAAFRALRSLGVSCHLTYIGNPSASDMAINKEIEQACQDRLGVTWITNASDADVQHHMASADFFLSFGTEGYGIPVLESIRYGTPVAFDGIQPAAELMEGRGATRLNASDVPSLTASLAELVSIDSALHVTVEPDAVPTWRDFSRAVAHAASI